MAAVQNRVQNQDEQGKFVSIFGSATISHSNIIPADRARGMDHFVGGALQSDIRSPSNGSSSGRGRRVLFIESHPVGPLPIVDSDRLCDRTRG